jgi:hypothetical protein
MWWGEFNLDSNMSNRTPSLHGVQVAFITYLKNGLWNGTLLSDVTYRLKHTLKLSFQVFFSVVNLGGNTEENISWHRGLWYLYIMISSVSNNFVSTINERKECWVMQRARNVSGKVNGPMPSKYALPRLLKDLFYWCYEIIHQLRWK